MNILAIGSHPDDLEFGCGGALYKFSKMGYKIHVLVITSGEVGGNSKIRRVEQEKASKVFHAKTWWGGFRDTDVPVGREIIQVVEKHVREIEPCLIFTHHPQDTHQDHRAVSIATTTAARYTRNVLYYEVLSTQDFRPSVFVDIGSVLEFKLRALKAHRSQVYQTRVQDLSILESAKATAIFRGYQDRVKYAEAFVPMRLSLDFGVCAK